MAGTVDIAARARESQAGGLSTAPFRFYDNRQKYLAFVNTCNEKAVIAERATREINELRPSPPALRLFDAGMGDATVLSRIMRSAHRRFPTVPFLVVAKEISYEDVRLGLEKMPDRFFEHPHTVLAVTNLSYADAVNLNPSNPEAATALNWQVVRLAGSCSHDYMAQIETLAPSLSVAWQTKPSARTGNPTYVQPSVLVMYRLDQEFVLDPLIPRPGRVRPAFDFILASQPWRARMSAEFKASKILSPLTRSLQPGGKLLGIQSYGNDPGLEIVQKVWPDEQPFTVGRAELVSALKQELGHDADGYDFYGASDQDAVFRYQMHTLPSEIGDRIGTSTLFAAWNAAIYVNQIEDERLDSILSTGGYLDATQEVLHRYGGLWFNDEAFVIERK